MLAYVRMYVDHRLIISAEETVLRIRSSALDFHGTGLPREVVMMGVDTTYHHKVLLTGIDVDKSETGTYD